MQWLDANSFCITSSDTTGRGSVLVSVPFLASSVEMLVGHYQHRLDLPCS